MSSATDVVRARAELFEMFAADRRSRDPIVTGFKRMNAALYMAGPGDAGHENSYDGTHNQQTLSTCMAASLLSGLTEARPDRTAVNYFVAPELHDSIVGIADALPDETIHDNAPPPSAAGFALLGTPWRWMDSWGHEHAVEAVTWAPGVVPMDEENGERTTLHPSFVGLWTRLPTTNYQYMAGIVAGQGPSSEKAQNLYEGFGRHGWLLTRVTTLFWTREGSGPERFELGPERFQLTAEEHARATDNPDNLPLVGDGSNYNAGRLVHALMLVLAGAQHVPGSTRDPVPAVQLPNRTREKYAKRSTGGPRVSMIYAGVQRPTTPRENVGTRGPIGVHYWRSETTRRIRSADGTVRIVKVRGGWCGDRTKPASERTKVRIASGTTAVPADVRVGQGAPEQSEAS